MLLEGTLAEEQFEDLKEKRLLDESDSERLLDESDSASIFPLLVCVYTEHTSH